MSKRQQIGRQQVAPAAFEIRFSTTDSLEFVEISPDLDPERNIPDPFKKRDKIPRNSGSGLTLENFVQNVIIPPSSKNSIINNDITSTTNNNRQWNNKHNIVSGDHNSPKTRFLNNNTNSNGGGKSWNSVGPETEKPDRSTITGKGKFTEKILTVDDEETMTTITNNVNSTSEKRNKPDDELISNGISNENGSSRNNKKRTLPIEEINVKENDGISTPPMTPTTSQSSNSNSVDDLQITTTELSSPPTPPPGSDISDNSLTSTKIPRLSTSSRPIVSTYHMELIEKEQREKQSESAEFEEQKEPEKYVKNKELKKVPRRRPTISHDEMIIPTIAKKLKMNGQLPYQNHDALLGTYDELDLDQPNPSLSSKNGNVNINDQVKGSFNENKNQQHHGRQSPVSSVPEYRRNRKNSSSQRSKIPSRRVEESSSPYADVDVEQEKKMIEFKKANRKSRREEFVLVIRDEDEEDEFGDIVKPRSSAGNSAEHEREEEISKETDNANQ
ncbi:3156_t:CDS:2 [Diversispora eburnea]|uniref:3156_t:CDS:1 n=1 Tax=Diversispora eburnea TaxID=1213867 RepID=A0A9N9A3L9_9GLOM|nr:3156_t:CDS:2 [Diversispora eburnea]